MFNTVSHHKISQRPQIDIRWNQPSFNTSYKEKKMYMAKHLSDSKASILPSFQVLHPELVQENKSKEGILKEKDTPKKNTTNDGSCDTCRYLLSN